MKARGDPNTIQRSSSLRLYEANEAKRWLAAYPIAHNSWEWRYSVVQSDTGNGTRDNEIDNLTDLLDSQPKEID